MASAAEWGLIILFASGQVHDVPEVAFQDPARCAEEAIHRFFDDDTIVSVACDDGHHCFEIYRHQRGICRGPEEQPPPEGDETE